jgi:YD repeat-containing protein
MATGLPNNQMPRGAITQNRYVNYDLTTGRLTSTTNPENGTVNFYYNSDGTLNHRTDAKNQTLQFTYDTYQRLTQKQKTGDSCSVINYAYNTIGQMASVTWGGTSCTGGLFTELYGYGAGNVMTSKTLRMKRWDQPEGTGTAEQTVNFGYNGEGVLSSLSLPTVLSCVYRVYGINDCTSQAGPSYSYTFDTLRRPTKVSGEGIDWASNVTYGPDNSLTAMTYLGWFYFNPPEAPLPNFYTETRTYNVRGQVTRINGGGSPVQYDLRCTFPASNDGRTTQEKDWRTGVEVNYAYDSLGRLSSASTTGPQWGLSFSYL